MNDLISNVILSTLQHFIPKLKAATLPTFVRQSNIRKYKQFRQKIYFNIGGKWRKPLICW